MTVPGEKMALFIDGANLYATAKSLGFDIDYNGCFVNFNRAAICFVRSIIPPWWKTKSILRFVP